MSPWIKAMVRKMLKLGPGSKKNEENAKAWPTHPTPRNAKAPEPLQERSKKAAEVSFPTKTREACEICEYTNHSTSDCRKMYCEICNCNTHTTYDCVNCLPWNYGPELCAAHVEGHSFFHIDEIIDTKISTERASTAIITVLRGKVTAKDIEQMFMNLLGANV
jgi:hypothetical protein